VVFVKERGKSGCFHLFLKPDQQKKMMNGNLAQLWLMATVLSLLMVAVKFS
jgi:hypothetical protein